MIKKKKIQPPDSGSNYRQLNKKKQNARSLSVKTTMKKPDRKIRSGKSNQIPDPIKIIPLGGMEQIGMNMTVIEYNGNMIVIDCGMAFADDTLLGIDLIIPDITYLKQNKSKVKAFLITHGHEDHIGALPYILKEIKVDLRNQTVFSTNQKKAGRARPSGFCKIEGSGVRQSILYSGF